MVTEKNKKSKTASMVAVSALIGIVLVATVQFMANSSGFLQRLAEVCFIEPAQSGLARSSSQNHALSSMLFVTWLGVAWVILKARRENRSVRVGFLMILPALAIIIFNRFFVSVAPDPVVWPTAVVAVLGAILYETGHICQWSRLFVVMVTLVTCFAYSMYTGLGVWGGIVATLAMVAVQLIWSSIEMRVYRLTFAMKSRKFEYR